MNRWRSPLALLGRSQGNASTYPPSTAYLASSVPDFLAPALSSIPTHTRRHKTSSARIISQPSGLETSEKAAGPSTSLLIPLPRNVQHDAADVALPSFFDASIPVKHSLVAQASESTSSDRTHKEQTDRTNAMLRAADSQASLDRAAMHIFESEPLKRERSHTLHRCPPSLHTSPTCQNGLALNSHFLLSLFKHSYQLNKTKDNKGFTGMDTITAKYLRMVSQGCSVEAFGDRFLLRFANQPDSQSAISVLDQLLAIIQRRIKTTKRSHDTTFYPHILLVLMQGFSRCGRQDRVQTCFRLLQEHALPMRLLHYQFHLVALFKENASRYIALKHNHQDRQRQLEQLQARILQVKVAMDANNIPFDDNLLATIVYGLSAPLRSPVSSVTSIAEANDTLKLVHALSARLGTQSHDNLKRASQSFFQSKPLLLLALVNAEIDAIERGTLSRPQDIGRAVKAISRLIFRLDSDPNTAMDEIVGTLERSPVTKSQLSVLVLRLRLSCALGDIDRGLEQMKILLAIDPATEANSAAQKRELVLKQRSGVIHLFSSAMQNRKGRTNQDAAWGVLNLALRADSLRRLWTRTHMPASPIPGCKMEAYNPNAIVLRLWKRWMHAWSVDHLALGNWIEVQEGEHRHVITYNMDRAADAQEKSQKKYDTFTSRYPWQTLKRGLKLLNHTLDQYKALALAKTPSASEGSGGKHSVIARYSSLFKDRVVLDNIVKLSLRGGRPPRNETMATHVHRRLTLMIRTLTRVRVSARVWEHVEASVISHLARIDRDILPTAAVREAMDEIKLQKRHAYLRNRDLLDAHQQQAQGNEEYPPEPGSIFVLRQMIEKTRQSRRTHNNPTPATSALTT